MSFQYFTGQIKRSGDQHCGGFVPFEQRYRAIQVACYFHRQPRLMCRLRQ